MGLSLSGVHHIGVTVSNIQRSLEFYRHAFGIEPHMRFEESGPEVDLVVGLQDAHLDVAFLNIGNTMVEFLEYRSPRGKAYDRRNCDVGATHICFEVPDIQAAYQQLSANGVEFTAPPQRNMEGPLIGWTFAYFSDPDGITVELCERPGS